jgi:hypothetical protein
MKVKNDRNSGVEEQHKEFNTSPPFSALSKPGREKGVVESKWLCLDSASLYFLKQDAAFLARTIT